MTGTIATFIPVADRAHRHEIDVRAPAELVLDVAQHFDLQSVRLVHAVFWLRAKLLRAQALPPRHMAGLVDEMTGLGWGLLAREPGRLLIMGSVTQPWVADVRFRTLPPDRFAAFSEPAQVKIAWTLEATPLGPARTRFGTETRAVATDDEARRRFRRYWRLFGAGIVLIRWLVLPAVRREAERRFRATELAARR